MGHGNDVSGSVEHRSFACFACSAVRPPGIGVVDRGDGYGRGRRDAVGEIMRSGSESESESESKGNTAGTPFRRKLAMIACQGTIPTPIPTPTPSTTTQTLDRVEKVRAGGYPEVMGERRCRPSGFYRHGGPLGPPTWRPAGLAWMSVEPRRGGMLVRASPTPPCVWRTVYERRARRDGALPGTCWNGPRAGAP